jgi:hypothetical protein
MFCLPLVVDKILKKKDYPLHINQRCHRVTVSPYIEKHLKKYQVKSSLSFHFESLLAKLAPQKIKNKSDKTV